MPAERQHALAWPADGVRLRDASSETPAVLLSPGPVGSTAFDRLARPVATAIKQWENSAPRPVSSSIAHDLISRSDEMRLAHADVGH
ncbi:hypothetical protein WME79_28225 [Sorangium sp. So ce726]|uniref:hypothetical protein n=1 Tax=Sorangium sp. So ce726 TaxID=3133319 RepID=UPI003F6100C4